MAKTFADEIRDRLPRVLTNIVTIFAIIFILYLIMPIAYVTSYVIPGIGVAAGVLIGVGALILALMFEARIYKDLQSLSNGLASHIVARRRHLTNKRREEVRSAFADLGKLVSFLILLALIAPVLVIIPGVGVVVVTLPILGVLILALYGWKSWEIAEEEFEKFFKAFADSLAKSFEK